jgi:hypothetical protein
MTSNYIKKKMEIIYEHYLINYLSNIDDFRINVYNTRNSKKYELIESALVTKYKDIGVDLFFILSESLNNQTFILEDNDKFINLHIQHKDIIKIKLIIGNILCEYKEASILDLKNEIIKMKRQIEELTEEKDILVDICKEVQKKRNIGDYVKIPNEIKTLVICKFIMGQPDYYPTIFPIYMHYLSGTTVCNQILNVKYYGKKFLNNEYSTHALKSPNEYYQCPKTPYLCFKENIDCNLISDMELNKLGLFNINILNINSLTEVSKLYLNNVKFIDESKSEVDVEIELTQLEELGVNQCVLSDLMIKSIIKLCKKGELKKIYIAGSNIKKAQIPSNVTVIE